MRERASLRQGGYAVAALATALGVVAILHVEAFPRIDSGLVIAITFFLAGGLAVGWVSYEIRRRSRASRAADGRFRAFLDESPLIAWAKDEAGRYLYLNRAYERRFGVRLDDFQGKTDFELRPPETARRLSQEDRSVLDQGGPEEFFEAMVEANDRRSDWVKFKFLFRDDRGKKYLGGVGYEVTEQRRAAEGLNEADRRKNEFMAVLAHELRNPLAPIRNGVQILKSKGPLPRDLEWATEVIGRQADQMARLLDDLLDVSRITRNRLGLCKEPVVIQTVLQRAVETSHPLILERKQKLTVSLPEAPVRVEADPLRLAQVFSNLLNNAAKYSGPGAHIALTAELEGRGIAVSVRDDGIGIEADVLAHVFEMFRQGGPALGSQSGLGIGLSLVKGLVELHGGTVEARSEGRSRGSEFVVRLPSVLDQASRETAADSSDREPAALVKNRVLVVDDVKDIADSTAMMLRILGNEVRTAYGGVEALRAARAFRPDVVLLDLGMPELSGYEIARRIREKRWGQSMFLVALTGWAQEEDRLRAQEAGFDEHLVKPVDPLALRKCLLRRTSLEPARKLRGRSRARADRPAPPPPSNAN